MWLISRLFWFFIYFWGEGGLLKRILIEFDLYFGFGFRYLVIEVNVFNVVKVLG